MSESKVPNAAEPAWWLYFKLMRLHGFPIGTKLPFTALGELSTCCPIQVVTQNLAAFGMLMGLQSIHAQSLDALYRKAGLWWLFIFIRHSGGCVWNDICDRDIDRAVGNNSNKWYFLEHNS